MTIVTSIPRAQYDQVEESQFRKTVEEEIRSLNAFITNPIAFTGRGIFADTSDIDLTDTLVALVTGVAAGQHIEYGVNTIQSKSGSNTATALNLNIFGGGVFAGETLNLVDSISELQINSIKVVDATITGWTLPTGTATRTGFVTSTVTLTVLAEHVKALIEDLGMLGSNAHGLISA